MFSLSTDHSFHYELLRTLSLSRYHGSDIAEILQAASIIAPGDIESFYSAFNNLALHVQSQANAIDFAKYPVSARDAYFRASSYFRAADFYLHGKPEDERINSLWDKQTKCFDNAISLLDIPGVRGVVQGDGFEIPVIFYAASKDAKPRPTLILGNGYDGAQEELLHFHGFAALERGINVLTYEGPGQCSVVRDQGKGFVAEWEKVVTPVVDYAATLPQIDMEKLGLVGVSMGGYLAVRAAAFEHRLKAAIAIDGVYDFAAALSGIVGPNLRSVLESGDEEAIEKSFKKLLDGNQIPTALRWGMEQGLWSFGTRSVVEFMDKAKEMTLKGLEDRIKCQVWVGEAKEDQFFKGQPQMVKDALGEKANLVLFGEEDAAENHCHVGAGAFLNQIVMDWFEGVVEK
jgi:pimeloyl-ACP methyl ester carboxylesterase